MKWFIVIVFPGVEDVLASCLLFVNMLIKDDLPTFDRPIKAYSGLSQFGNLLTLVLLCRNVADLMFIFSNNSFVLQKYEFFF